MEKLINVIIYDEPDRKNPGKNNRIVRTEKEAIKISKDEALKYGSFCYINDKEALYDYMLGRWAWKETKKLK